MKTKTKHVVVKFTPREAEALDLIVCNGWGDGDFAGWGGQNPKTQKRAIGKLRESIMESLRCRIQ